ncbi:FISUMP domain-containing protein [uncultured Fibrobacter sp.]|uniref:FISUMP domain-containing protein n=1 Tax=uncultured Fibrobacter sp. TaxID=261512 RepID=UPI002620A6B4|nr:FISUMP domain-containing protein [uncultured Fibrobacter sp.]
MAKIMNRCLISLSVVFMTLSIAVAGEVHPGLKNAIDNGDYKMAKNLIEKVGVKDIYCPGSLSVMDAEKVYGSILKEDPFAIIEGYKGNNVFVDPNFEIEYAENKCNSSQMGDGKICGRWKEHRALKRDGSVSKMFDKWIKEDKGLCLNAETMNNCVMFVIKKNDVKEQMEIIRKIDKKKLIKYEGVVEKDTVVKEPIPKDKCLFNLRDFEQMQTLAIGAKQNATGTFEFPFGYCTFNGTKQAINTCVKKLHEAVKDAEKKCKSGKMIKDVKKTVKRKELVFPLKYEMMGIRKNLLAVKWYEMDDEWWENFTLLSKYLDNPKEKDAVDEMKQKYSSKGDFDIADLVRNCKIYPSIDKKIAKAFGFEVFSCKKLLNDYMLRGEKCDAEKSSWILKMPTTLNGRDSVAALACDAKTGKFRSLEKYEFISKEFCENVESSWMKTYYKISYDVGYGRNPVWYDSITIVCDKKDGKFRDLNLPEKYMGLCTKEKQNTEFFVWATCVDEMWQDTKIVNTKNQKFEPGEFVEGEINSNYHYFKDLRDNQIYRAVKIEDQIWMAENLNYSDSRLLANSWCYDNDSSNCELYGRLYTWSAAMDALGTFSNSGKGCGNNNTECVPQYPVRGICPEGWHLPDSLEWKTLYRTVGGKPYAIQANNLWPNAADEYSLSIVPAGSYNEKKFYPSDAFFWSSTKDGERIYRWYVGNQFAGFEDVYNKGQGYSIRCLKDASK